MLSGERNIKCTEEITRIRACYTYIPLKHRLAAALRRLFFYNFHLLNFSRHNHLQAAKNACTNSKLRFFLNFENEQVQWRTHQRHNSHDERLRNFFYSSWTKFSCSFARRHGHCYYIATVFGVVFTLLYSQTYLIISLCFKLIKPDISSQFLPDIKCTVGTYTL